MNGDVFLKLHKICLEFESLQTMLPNTKTADKLVLAFRNYFRLVLSLHIPGENGELKKLDVKDLEAIIAAYNRLMQVDRRLSEKQNVKERVNSLLKAVREYHACLANASPVYNQDIVWIENLAAERDIIEKAHLTPEVVNKVISGRVTLRRSKKATKSDCDKFDRQLSSLKDSYDKIDEILLQQAKMRYRLIKATKKKDNKLKDNEFIQKLRLLENSYSYEGRLFQKLESIDDALTSLYAQKVRLREKKRPPISGNMPKTLLHEIERTYILPQEIATLKTLNDSLIEAIESYFQANKSLQRDGSEREMEAQNAVNWVIIDIYTAALKESEAYELQKFRVDQKLYPVLRRLQRESRDLSGYYNENSKETIRDRLKGLELDVLASTVQTFDKWLLNKKKAMDDLRFPNLPSEEIARESLGLSAGLENQQKEISKPEEGKKVSQKSEDTHQGIRKGPEPEQFPKKEREKFSEKTTEEKGPLPAKTADNVQQKSSSAPNIARKKEGHGINNRNSEKSTDYSRIGKSCDNLDQRRQTQNRIPINFYSSVNQGSSVDLRAVSKKPAFGGKNLKPARNFGERRLGANGGGQTKQIGNQEIPKTGPYCYQSPLPPDWQEKPCATNQTKVRQQAPIVYWPGTNFMRYRTLAERNAYYFAGTNFMRYRPLEERTKQQQTKWYVR